MLFPHEEFARRIRRYAAKKLADYLSKFLQETIPVNCLRLVANCTKIGNCAVSAFEISKQQNIANLPWKVSEVVVFLKS